MPRNLVSPDNSPLISSPTGDPLVSELVCADSTATSAQATSFGDALHLNVWGDLVGNRNLADAAFESEEAAISAYAYKPLGISASLESEVAEVSASLSRGLFIELSSGIPEIHAEFELFPVVSISPALEAPGSKLSASSEALRLRSFSIAAESGNPSISASAQDATPVVIEIGPSLETEEAEISASATALRLRSATASLQPKEAEAEASATKYQIYSDAPDLSAGVPTISASATKIAVSHFSVNVAAENPEFEASATKLDRTAFKIMVASEKASIDASIINPLGFSISVSPEAAEIETSVSTQRSAAQTLEAPEALMIAKASVPDRENRQLYRVIDIQYTPDGQFKTLFLQAAKRPVTR